MYRIVIIEEDREINRLICEYLSGLEAGMCRMSGSGCQKICCGNPFPVITLW